MLPRRAAELAAEDLEDFRVVVLDGPRHNAGELRMWLVGQV